MREKWLLVGGLVIIWLGGNRFEIFIRNIVGIESVS